MKAIVICVDVIWFISLQQDSRGTCDIDYVEWKNADIADIHISFGKSYTKTLLGREQNILEERENGATYPVRVAQFSTGISGRLLTSFGSFLFLPSLGKSFRPVLATGRTENIEPGVHLLFFLEFTF